MKKICYFYIYVTDDFTNNIVVKLHEVLLRKYANIFDEFIFVLSINDIFDKKKIDYGIEFIKQLNINNYKVYMVKNDKNSGEAVLLLNFVIPHIMLNKECGNNDYIFFGHLKGITDITKIGFNPKSILNWIASLYFYSFEYIDEMILLFNSGAALYGPLKTKFYSTNLPHTKIKNHQFNYPGTFYWINSSKIIDNMCIKLTEFKQYINRFIAEDFPFFIKQECVVSHKNIHTVWLKNCDLYMSNDNIWYTYLKVYGDSDRVLSIINESNCSRS